MRRDSIAHLPTMLGATARTVPPGVVAMSVLAVAPAVMTAVTGGHDFANALSAASVIAGSAVGYAVDDPAAPTLASSPTTLAVRRGMRALLIVAVVLIAWSVALLVADRYGTSSADVGALAGELCATAAVSAAIASRARTDASVSTGAVAAAGALLIVVTISAFAYHWPALPAIGRAQSHHRWWLIAGLGLAIAAWSSRDPAARFARARRA